MQHILVAPGNECTRVNRFVGIGLWVSTTNRPQLIGLLDRRW